MGIKIMPMCLKQLSKALVQTAIHSLTIVLVANDYCGIAAALPPLGLTPIPSSTGSLEIIEGTAYIGTSGGITTVSANGAIDLIPILHPALSPLFFVTGVVKANDDRLYTAASYGSLSNSLGGALFRLDEPSNPLVTWEGHYRLRGVDRNLTAYGNKEVADFTEATLFFLDGSSQPMSYPGGSANLTSVTPNGYALGDAHIPNTLGSAPAMWSPSGEFSFLSGVCCIPSSIRDRQDGDGVNIGTDGEVKYGSDGPIEIGLGWVIVSHSDFAVVSNRPSDPKYAFYPGINPDHPDQAVPLLDIFPELATIDIDYISDLASVDGYLYMTLSGSDGTFLFGARDPSVIVPEPATAVMMLLGTILCAVMSRADALERLFNTPSK